MDYDLEEHRHRFAVWAGARAAHRGLKGGKVELLREALESTDIRSTVTDPKALNEPINAEDYDDKHHEWCDAVLTYLRIDVGIKDATFGRAAKLVAVYIKTMIVIGPNFDSQFAKVAYPPIDGILLKALSKSDNITDEGAKHYFGGVKWTQLDADGYETLISTIRKCVPNIDPFWHLEQYWDVTS